MQEHRASMRFDLLDLENVDILAELSYRQIANWLRNARGHGDYANPKAVERMMKARTSSEEFARACESLAKKRR